MIYMYMHIIINIHNCMNDTYISMKYSPLNDEPLNNKINENSSRLYNCK